MPVDPTGDDVRRFRDEDDGGPVVMLNLLRFAGDAGRASYASYSAAIQPFLEAAGASVVYAGDCSTALVAPPGHSWDALLVVRYPSRAAFLQMLRDPDYQAITELRTAALQSAVLQATTPWA